MNGMINRAIERFVRDVCGRDVWYSVITSLRLDVSEFDPFASYDDHLTIDLVVGIARQLERAVPDVLEDLGTYLITYPTMAHVRRLLRFGGRDFADFLESLEDFPARVRMALPGLSLPQITLEEQSASHFVIRVLSGEKALVGFGHAFVGVLRAMADDYGALVLLDHQGGQDGVEMIGVTIAQSEFTSGRRFRFSEVML